MPDLVEVESLPQQPSAAAAHFYAHHMAGIVSYLASGKGDLVLILPFAEVEHDDWRRAAARDLARDYAPHRVNVIGGGDAAARAETLAYLRDAPGVTGQYLALS